MVTGVHWWYCALRPHHAVGLQSSGFCFRRDCLPGGLHSVRHVWKPHERKSSKTETSAEVSVPEQTSPSVLFLWKSFKSGAGRFPSEQTSPYVSSNDHNQTSILLLHIFYKTVVKTFLNPLNMRALCFQFHSLNELFNRFVSPGVTILNDWLRRASNSNQKSGRKIFDFHRISFLCMSKGNNYTVGVKHVFKDPIMIKMFKLRIWSWVGV